ncbi:unnamed protein product [Peronospora belbahrii]|uniref:Uncharacterized protein n=1 Tax=Peronospora belbahrii TaxID=622444 RepID=A0AAU9KW32_9STRA|nr:unnamed protein product [Peronospora belbahrii]
MVEATKNKIVGNLVSSCCFVYIGFASFPSGCRGDDVLDNQPADPLNFMLTFSIRPQDLMKCVAWRRASLPID